MTDTNRAMFIDPKYKQPGYYYTWGLDHPNWMTGAQIDGYEMVKIGDPEGKLMVAAGDPRIRTVDGTIRVGDAPLMRIKKEVKDARDADLAARRKGAVQAVKEDFKSNVGALGLEAFEDAKP